MRDLDTKAREAKDKKAALGQDIDLDSFTTENPLHEPILDMEQLPETERKRMLMAGIDAQSGVRSGTYLQ
jgi:hypothetical protein